MSYTQEELEETVTSALPKGLEARFVPSADEVTLEVESQDVLRLLCALRDNGSCQFKQLVDVCGVDYPAREKRFEVVYHLLSLKYNCRVRVKVALAEGEEVPSAVDIFSNANWLEREVYDMYGVVFTDHPDLRRILTDYGFEGHPQRKDFPLTGYKEVHYSEKEKRVVQAPVSLPQAFRNFDFESPWEGTDYVLPGDEKATG